MVIIEPSILSADFARLGEQALEAQAAGVGWIQVDVMDGRFVPNLTFGADMVRALRRILSVKLDVHLMMVEPERHIHAFARAGADRIIVHQETCPILHGTIQMIHEFGIQAGVALNPSTPAVMLDEVLDGVDVIQVMTVDPGFGGQAFIASQINKVQILRKALTLRGKDTPITVDGGIDRTTAPMVVEAGATILVAGSSVYNEAGSVAENIAALQASIRDS
jgi:ribulose-phosphate 3-epimerase